MRDKIEEVILDKMALENDLKEMTNFQNLYEAVLEEKEALESELTEILKSQLNTKISKSASKSAQKLERERSKKINAKVEEFNPDMRPITEREEYEEDGKSGYGSPKITKNAEELYSEL